MTALWTKRSTHRLDARRKGTLKGLRERLYVERRRIATVAAAALAVGIGYHVVFGHNGLTVFESKRRETQTLEREMKVLAHENDALSEHVERLKTDPAAIEHQAREELHYTRPGEVIVTLSPERAAPGNALDAGASTIAR